MKKWMIVFAISGVIYACGNQNNTPVTTDGTETTGTNQTQSANPDYDPKRGEGKFKNVEVSPTIDDKLASTGEKSYGVKCGSCHKLTDERLVGPGWLGVTKRNTAAWILNFITNTDEMLTKDPKAQSQLEICLVRMPNQNLSDDEAKALYEFMRKNDSK